MKSPPSLPHQLNTSSPLKSSLLGKITTRTRSAMTTMSPAGRTSKSSCQAAIPAQLERKRLRSRVRSANLLAPSRGTSLARNRRQARHLTGQRPPTTAPRRRTHTYQARNLRRISSTSAKWSQTISRPRSSSSRCSLEKGSSGSSGSLRWAALRPTRKLSSSKGS